MPKKKHRKTLELRKKCMKRASVSHKIGRSDGGRGLDGPITLLALLREAIFFLDFGIVFALKHLRSFIIVV